MPNNYLIEIGTEELPPTSLKKLSDAFSQGIEKALRAKGLSFTNTQAFATPRRLALVIESLDEKTPIEELISWGPPAAIAFDKEGKPTNAALAFAKKNGLDVNKLVIDNDGKADKLIAKAQIGGEQSQQLIADIVKQSLANLPIAKRMRWGSSREEFVRPVQWVILLQDEQVIDCTILGVKASNITRGHRFHCANNFVITSAMHYEEQMQVQGHIIASFEKRREKIKKGVLLEAQKIKGTAVICDDLLDETTGLVEWPVPLAGRFDAAFLSVPAEALISSMKEHQKYFHIVDEKNTLLPFFITISNIQSKDSAQVIDGNERVIRPRLADAAFFYETDKKTSLASKRDKLKTVVFQDKLGSIFDKTERIKNLAHYIAEKLSANTSHVSRAAQLCKSDLVSNMVYEFPEMQGIAGNYYAIHDGEAAEVASAIVEHYQPRFAGDQLPANVTGSIIALADRIDTITGIFGIGQIPTGSKDPFALRRASLGVLRILVENTLDLDLRDLVIHSVKSFNALPKSETVVEDVLTYMIERFRSWYEEENIAAEIFQSVNSRKLTHPLDINNRVHAVSAFTQLDSAKALAAANKRVSNILAKLDSPVSHTYDENLFVEQAEKELAKVLKQADKKVQPLFDKHNYTEGLAQLAVLQEPVDTFFDQVMVMSDDLSIRNNRLSLLQQLRELFLHVADISYLDVKNKR